MSLPLINGTSLVQTRKSDERRNLEDVEPRGCTGGVLHDATSVEAYVIPQVTVK